MPNALRTQSNLWNNQTVGSNAISTAADIGSRSNVALFILSDITTTITILCSPGTGGAGRNSQPEDDTYYTLLKDDGSGAFAITVTGGTAVCIDLSPFAPQYIKLKTSAGATLTAGVDVVG